MVCVEVHCESKKQDTKLLFVFNTDQFLKFFHYYTQQDQANYRSHHT